MEFYTENSNGSHKPDPIGDDQSFDFTKLQSILRKSLPLMLLFMLVSVLAAYLYLRYTKPLYESNSVLKLDVESQASVLGIPKPQDFNLQNLSGEIELLRSSLFFQKVVDAVNFRISYYTYGKILYEERYRSNPFEVILFENTSPVYDRKVDVTILDRQRYRIGYPETSENQHQEAAFGDEVELNGMRFQLFLTKSFVPEMNGMKFFFIINSDASLHNYISRNLKVAPLNFNANTIQISFQDHNRNKARDLVNAIDTIYLNYTLEEKNKANYQKIEFLNQQLNYSEKKLETYEDYFENFTIENKTINLESDLNKTIQVLFAIDSQRTRLQNLETQVVQFRTQLEKGEDFVISPIESRYFNGSFLTTLEEFQNLKRKKELALFSYNENTFAVQKIVQELDNKKNNLREMLSEYQDQLQKRISNLNQRQEQLEMNFAELPAKGTAFSKARRYYSLYESFYLTLMQKKSEFEIAQAGMVTDFKILSPASIPAEPVFPNKLMIYGFGIMGGIMMSLLLVGIRFILYDQINSIQELEKLSKVPVLGLVPVNKGKKKSQQLIVQQHPRSDISEALRSIRTNMDFINARQEKKIISVTSTISGEGKTFISNNLGAILAMSGKKVVVIDLDMRKPSLHKFYGNTENGKGISTALIRKCSYQECILPTEIENLYYIPSGPIPPNPSELIMTEEFKLILERLREDFDLLILDTPPIGLVTDGMLAIRKSDISIFVVRAEYSKREFVRQINKMHQLKKLNNLSLILNAAEPGATYGYGKSYGYKGGYYSDQNAESGQRKTKEIS